MSARSAISIHRLQVWAPFTALLALAVWSTFSMWDGYWHLTHEYIWYPVRLVEYLQALRAGSLYPRWCPDFYGGYGYPFFNFYAPGVFATAAAFVLTVGAGPAVALKLAVTLFCVLGAFGMYFLAKVQTGRRDAAFLAAVVFAFVPYRFIDLFVRGDLAEYSAFSLVPTALAAYLSLTKVDERRVPWVGFAAAVSHAAVILCHTITGLWATQLFAVLLGVHAWRLWRTSERRRVLALAAAFAAAMGIAAVYTMPALLEKALVRISSIDSGPYHPTKNLVHWEWTVNTGFFALGLPAMLGLGVALASQLLPWARRSAGALLFFWLPSVVLWSLMQTWAEPFWRYWPLGSYIQFPWRLLGFIGVLAAAGVAVAFSAIVKPSWRSRWPLALGLALGVICAERSYATAGKFLAREKIPLTPEEIAAGLNTSVLVDEYLPNTVTTPPAAPRDQVLFQARNNDTLVALRQPGSLDYVLRVRTHDEATVDLQVFWFPGWKLRAQSGPSQVTIGASPRGLIRLTFPRAGEYTVHVGFGLTPLRALATLLSWLSILLIYPLLRRIMRKLNGPERLSASR